MESDRMPRGQAVAEKVTVQFLTLPDGSRRRVLSRAVGHDYAVHQWLVEEASENPKKWFDLGDLYATITGGKPLRINRADRKKLRGVIGAAKTFGLNCNHPIATKTDNHGGVTHFKLADRTNPKELALCVGDAEQSRRMERAWSNRTSHLCEATQTDKDQLDAIIAVKNKQRAEQATSTT